METYCWNQACIRPIHLGNDHVDKEGKTFWSLYQSQKLSDDDYQGELADSFWSTTFETLEKKGQTNESQGC